MQYNEISFNNGVGLFLKNTEDNAITFNNIHNNTLYGFVGLFWSDNATHNWWGDIRPRRCRNVLLYESNAVLALWIKIKPWSETRINIEY